MGNLDEPAFLPVGTEVSAKYKGAFCEAKIKKISKLVKCKVQYSNGTVSLISDEVVKGPLKVGAIVEIKGDKKELGEATVQKIQDYSQYTVVFDDGDITCLKRSALCLKSGRHFAASSSLDQLPLTHPEHNINLNSANTNTVRGRRSQKGIKTLGVVIKEEIIEMVEFVVGSVLCVETNDKKKVRDNWFPGLIVAPTAQSSIKTNSSKEYLVRSFKDGKYYTVQKKESLKIYTSEIGAKVENPTLKTAVEKTQLYITKDELPPHWDRDLLFGTDKCITTDSEGAYDSENSDEESIEEKDHFVAQLFKFMDDRGTPLNELPQLNGKDLDLYKLFKVVNNLGGLNKVSKYEHWHVVAFKMGEENMNENEADCFRRHYQTYLHSFEEFHRKLGCTMLSHPRGVRSRSRFSRNIIRDIDKALPSTSTAEKNKQSSAKQETNDKKDKTDTVKENDTFKDPVTIKKTTKCSKSDDKSNKIPNESAKKGEKKKDDNSSNISRSKSVKWDPEILDSKDPKTKKESKENLKKEPDVKDGGIESSAKKEPKKKNARNLFGKNARKTPKKEKVVKVKSAETGLPALRKVRSIKEQIKTFVKVITPFSKSKRGVSNTQQESLNKSKPDEDMPKLTRSKSKEEVPNKSRRASILSDSVVSSATLQSDPSGSVVDNHSKVKKLEDGSEKKKPVRKKKDDKVDKITSNDLNTTPISSEAETLNDSPSVISNGDHIVVFYGDDDAITYDAKILRISMVDGVLKYLVHYKGWNSRYDEWVESSRTALKSKGSSREPEHDETDPLKTEPNKSIEVKKPTPTNRTRRSATPSLSNSNRKKSPFSSVRPTRTCTLNDRLLSSIDNSDSESEDIVNLDLAKQNKKNQQSITSVKSEQEDIIIKTEPIETDNQKKIYPKTYPSKEVLMQRNVPKKPKSNVLKVHSNKSEGAGISEQVSLKPTFEYNFEMPPPSSVKKTNSSNENEVVQNKNKIDKDIQNEPKIAHYLSPKEKSEKNSQQRQSISETQKSIDNIELNVESQPLTATPKSTSVIYYPSSIIEEKEEEEEQKGSEQISSRDDKPDESKISGTDFDLNKIRSEMKGLMPTSTSSSNLDLIPNTESVCEEQVSEIPKSIEPVTEDIYEFTESEPCDFENIPSVIEEKQRRVIKHIEPPKSHNFEPPVELPRVIESITPVETVEQIESITPFVSDSHNDTYSFDDNIKVENIEKVDIKIENSVPHYQPDSDSHSSENLVINDASTDTNRISQNKICDVELDVTRIKDEVLDLCMKPPESPPTNIFSMPESNDTIDIIEDDDDDDESKLVIAENDKIDNEYQMDSNQMLSEENNFSNERSENVPISSQPPSPVIHQLPSTDSEFHSSYDEQRNIPKDIDDESTTSCNESVQNALIQNFQMYSNFENQSTKTKDYQTYLDNNDDSTKSCFEFDSNSKSPTIDNTGSVECDAKLSIYESTNNIKQEFVDYENGKIEEKPEKLSTSILPELQCREEIVDEDTLNNALVIEYNRKTVDYDIHKPSTSKGFFDSINHPSTSKDSFYETDPESDLKNSLYDSRQMNLVKSVIFDSNSPSTSRSGLFDENTLGSSTKDNLYDCVPSSSKSGRFYETSGPSSSKSFYNPESDVNNVLFCEETIPGSPTGISEDHYDHEERKRALSQANYDGKEAREAASAMFALKDAYSRPLITKIGASEKELEEYTNMLHNDGGLLDQRHLQFLAEVSSRNLNEPIDIEPLSERIIKSPEKSHTKRKSSNHEHSTSKRNKASTSAPTPEASIEKPIQVPLKDGKPLITFTPEMDSAQRQALLVSRMNDLRKEYILVKSRISVIDRRRKKIRKRKRELAKAATLAQNKQNQVACTAK